MKLSKQEFKELKAKWDKKLAKTGFKDVETPQSIQSAGTYFFHRYNPQRFAFIAEYYRQAGFFLHYHEFETPLEKQIWEHHANGKSIREIVKLYDDGRRTKRLTRWAVHTTIQKLTELMKLAIKEGKNEQE